MNKQTFEVYDATEGGRAPETITLDIDKLRHIRQVAMATMEISGFEAVEKQNTLFPTEEDGRISVIFSQNLHIYSDGEVRVIWQDRIEPEYFFYIEIENEYFKEQP